MIRHTRSLSGGLAAGEHTSRTAAVAGAKDTSRDAAASPGPTHGVLHRQRNSTGSRRLRLLRRRRTRRSPPAPPSPTSRSSSGLEGAGGDDAEEDVSNDFQSSYVTYHYLRWRLPRGPPGGDAGGGRFTRRGRASPKDERGSRTTVVRRLKGNCRARGDDSGKLLFVRI